MLRHLLIVAFLTTILPTRAQEYLTLVWDRHASPIAGAETLLSVHQQTIRWHDRYLQPRYWTEDRWDRKALGIGYRFGKAVLIDYQLDWLLHLFQHEVTGHGFRYRAVGYTDNSYWIGLFPPYGNGGGFARRGTLAPGRTVGFHENILISSGGSEAAAVTSQRLLRRWLRRGTIHYRESLLYLSTLYDYTAYAYGTKLSNDPPPGNDVLNYLRQVNAIYGFRTPEDYQITLDDLVRRSSVNLLHTFQLFAIATAVKTSLIDGNSEFTYPMIPLGNTDWLPSIRFGLTPFGTEFIVENFLRREREFAILSVRLGDRKLDRYFGVGATYQRRHSARLEFGASLDVWQQPGVQIGGTRLTRTDRGPGGRLLGELRYHPSPDFPVGLYLPTGYKTTGHIEGEVLREDFILRLGLSIQTE